MTYISVDEVRNRSGAPVSLITDAQIQSFIDQVEPEMERWLNTKFTPTQKIDFLNGNGKSDIFVRKNPLLSVRGLNSNDEDITLTATNWNRPSGRITLTGTAETGTFISKNQGVKVKYLYGFLDESSTETETTAITTIGSSVVITVTDTTDFAVNDWIEIYGMDGNREVAKITLIEFGTNITLDRLVKTHESGSIVVKLQIPEYIKTYMMIEAAICVALNAIGATYVFNASYSLGDLSVVKGVPYTHWQSSIEKLYKEREMRRSRIKPRPSIMVD